MQNLVATLFGYPKITIDGTSIKPERRKALALFAYLAVTHTPQPRDTLSTLLWPKLSQTRARANLRRTLTDLRQSLGPRFLAVDGEMIGLQTGSNVFIDVLQFRRNVSLLEGGMRDAGVGDPALLEHLEEAAALFQDDFLAGFTLPDSAAFDDWQMRQNDKLLELLSNTLKALADQCVASNQLPDAIHHSQRRLSINPLDELVHRRLMQLYLIAGDRSAAIRQYRTCEQILHDELSVAPVAATQSLYETIIDNNEYHSSDFIDLSKGQIVPNSPQSSIGTEDHLSEQDSPASSPSRVREADELRIATALFVGFAGGVAAQALDPEVTVSRVSRLLRLVEGSLSRYDARVGRLVENGLLVILGLDQTHEDDPERAIHVALKILDLAQQEHMHVSIGIGTGKVFRGLLTAGHNEQQSVIGPVVDTAVRLQANTNDSQVWVDAATYRQSNHAVAYRPLTYALAGCSESRTVYEVQSLSNRRYRGRRRNADRTPLVGRHAETSILSARLATALSGNSQLINVTGIAGVGKSRLVVEVKRWIDSGEYEARWLEGRCLEMNQAIPYGPFVDLLRSLFNIHEEMASTSIDIRTQAELNELVNGGYLSAEQCHEIGVILGLLLSIQETDERQQLSYADPQQIRHRTFVAMQQFFVALSRQHPTILVLEDLHWADPLSIDLVSALMDTLDRVPAAIICLFRPEYQHGSSHLGSNVRASLGDRFTGLYLEPLAPDESKQLVDSMLPESTGQPALIEQVLQRGQGVPFYIEEIVRYVIDTGGHQLDGIEKSTTNDLSSMMPEDVERLIMSRVDRLDPTCKEILRQMAVVGRLVPYPVLDQVIAADVDLAGVVWELVERGFIHQERAAPIVEYSFQHVLTQVAVYRSLPRADLGKRHLRIARALEELHAANLTAVHGQLAYHYDLGENEAKAIEYGLLAGEDARRAHLHAEAAGHFHRVVERLESSNIVSSRWRLWLRALLGLGRVQMMSGDLTKSQATYQRAINLGLALGAPARDLVKLYYWHGEALTYLGRSEELIALGKRGLSLLGDEQHCTEAALMHLHIALGYQHRGNEQEQRRFTGRNLNIIPDLPYCEEIRPAYVQAAIYYYLLDRKPDAALHWLNRLGSVGREHYDQKAVAEAELFSGLIHFHSGRLTEAIACANRALYFSEMIGDRMLEFLCNCLFYSTLLASGQAEEAAQTAIAIYEMLNATGPRSELSWWRLSIAEARLCQNHPEAGVIVRHADDLYQEHYDIVSPMLRAETCLRLGWAHRAIGDDDQALRRFREALALAEPDYRSPLAEWRPWRSSFAAILTGLEAVLADDTLFQACYEKYWNSFSGSERTDTQWYLSPSRIDSRNIDTHNHGFALTGDKPSTPTLSAHWRWFDPYGDSTLLRQDGVMIEAVNGRDLWFINQSAPRLLRPVSGSFTLQARCSPLDDTRPAVGGLLIWKDAENFVRLDCGSRGPNEVSFSGYVADTEHLIGRGQLSIESVWLRIERSDVRLKALCSDNGTDWFIVGQIDFFIDGMVEAGLFASGSIDRMIQPGSHANGTAIHFDSIELRPSTY